MSNNENIYTASPPCPVCGKGHLVFFPVVGGSPPVWVCTFPDCNYQISTYKEPRNIYKFNF